MSEELNENLKEKAARYKELTESLEEKKAEIRAKKDELEKQIAPLKDELSKISDDVSKEASEIEDIVTKLFEATGNKKFYGGFGVQKRKEIDYDESEAFEWAKEKGMFLQLDKKAFEKAAPTMEKDLNGIVEIKSRVKVTFPKVAKLEE